MKNICTLNRYICWVVRDIIFITLICRSLSWLLQENPDKLEIEANFITDSAGLSMPWDYYQDLSPAAEGLIV